MPTIKKVETTVSITTYLTTNELEDLVLAHLGLSPENTLLDWDEYHHGGGGIKGITVTTKSYECQEEELP